uniref:GCR005 n=1 Tax=Schmidtea mediterranea TaxID=79327 RepID=A0A193KU21_SCHMD|nr:GCR005 [Schmidtea mediterranea]
MEADYLLKSKDFLARKYVGFPSVESVFILFVLILIDLSILIGNILVIIAASTSVKLRRYKTNIFIINLAVSDLLLGIIVLPLSIGNQVLNRRWFFGNALCKIWLASDVLLCTASILNLTVISFDRYIAIRNPIRYLSWMTNKNCQILLTSVWIFAFIISFPNILTLVYQNTIINIKISDVNPTRNMSFSNLSIHAICSITDSSPGYIIYSAFGSYYIPLIVMVYFYASIFATAHKTICGIAKGRLKNRDGKTIIMRVHCGGFRTDSSSKSQCLESSDETGKLIQSTPRHRISNCPFKFCCQNKIPFTTPKFSFNKSNSHNPNLDDCKSIESINFSQRDTGIESDYELLKSNVDSINLTKTKRSLTQTSEIKIIPVPLSRMQREAKAARMLGIICGAFILCWLPFFIVYVTGAFYKNIPDSWFDGVFWLGYCNSLLNPWIYALFSKDFRLAYRRFLCRKRF